MSGPARNTAVMRLENAKHYFGLALILGTDICPPSPLTLPRTVTGSLLKEPPRVT